MKINYKFYLVLSILVLSFTTANYGSKYFQIAKQKLGKSFKRFRRIAFGSKYGQKSEPSAIRQAGINQNIINRMSEGYASKEFGNQKNNKVGWVAWFKKLFGIRQKTPKAIEILINNRDTPPGIYEPANRKFHIVGKLPSNELLRTAKEDIKTPMGNFMGSSGLNHSVDFYEISLSPEQQAEFSGNKKFIIAIEKNSNREIVDLVGLSINPDKKTAQIEAFISDPIQRLSLKNIQLGDFTGSSLIENAIFRPLNEGYGIELNEATWDNMFRKYKIDPNLAQGGTNGNKPKSLEENIKELGKLKEEIKKSSESRVEQLEEIKKLKEIVENLEVENLETTLNENDEFQNRFLKHNAYLKEPISRLRLKTKKNIDINNASYQLQWYQAVKYPGQADDIVVVAALKNQAGTIVEFLCLEIKPRDQAVLVFKSHEDVTKEGLEKSVYDITEEDYPLTKKNKLEALKKFTQENVQELYQLSLVDLSGSYGTKIKVMN